MLRTASRFSLLLAAVLGVLGPGLVDAQEPILERYVLGVGATDGFGVEAVVVDPQFGNGTARSRLRFTGPPLGDPDGNGRLVLRVSRKVAEDEITFALLVSRVEVRGFNAEGTRVYTHTFGEFSFGDSRPGDWRRVLDDLPASVVRVTVTFFGNYE